MILSFKHRGLKALYNGRTARRVAAEHEQKLRDILALLDQARDPADMDLPGARLHRLGAALRGHHAVSVSGNWRVSFQFEGGHALDVDYLDYH